MKTTILHYRKYLFMYGVLSVLYVIKYFEDIENYEECQKIIDAINEQEQKLDCKLPKVINKESIEYILDIWKHEISDDFLIYSSKYYSELIIKEINLL